MHWLNFRGMVWKMLQPLYYLSPYNRFTTFMFTMFTVFTIDDVTTVLHNPHILVWIFFVKNIPYNTLAPKEAVKLRHLPVVIACKLLTLTQKLPVQLQHSMSRRHVEFSRHKAHVLFWFLICFACGLTWAVYREMRDESAESESVSHGEDLVFLACPFCYMDQSPR